MRFSRLSIEPLFLSEGTAETLATNAPSFSLKALRFARTVTSCSWLVCTSKMSSAPSRG
uniref:Uncharacterized protein n=1 Tax=Myoviridae sp. ctO4916 TaxID=2826645 RepID=A0A8S5N4Y6_9CAUD|nr:MAG TPA: hypothetical protein [Myoviridae sp. ctO4916]